MSATGSIHCRDWVAKVIKGPPEDRVANRDGTITDGQRGYIYRLFGYFGGPLCSMR